MSICPIYLIWILENKISNFYLYSSLNFIHFRPMDPSNKKQSEEEYLNFATAKIARTDLLVDKSSEQTTSKNEEGENIEEKQNTFPHPILANSTNSDASNSNGITKNSDKFEG